MFCILLFNINNPIFVIPDMHIILFTVGKYFLNINDNDVDIRVHMFTLFSRRIITSSNCTHTEAQRSVITVGLYCMVFCIRDSSVIVCTSQSH